MSRESEILNRFLEDIHEKLCLFKFPAEVVNDLQQAVEEMVGMLVRKISRCAPYPFFSGSRIVSRGSFYEGTKVDLPDEFDFLVELDKLSKPGSLEFISECPDCPGSVHVKLVDPELQKVNKKLNDSPMANYLKPVTINAKYRHCLQQAVLKLFPDSFGCVSNARIDKGCGFLNLREHICPVLNAKPNTVIELLWTTTTLPVEHLQRCICLSVDISPAIIYAPEGKRDSTISGKKCHVVPTANLRCVYGADSTSCCWRISHSEEELEKMQKLSETHRKIYKILKCVCKRKYGGLRSLTSYILKTAVLHHSESCNNNYSVGTCTMKVLTELYDYADKGHLPGYFVPEKNVWARNQEDKIVTPQPILQLLLDEFKTVSNTSPADYDFEKAFRKFRMLMEEFAIIEGAELFAHYLNFEPQPYVEKE